MLLTAFNITQQKPIASRLRAAHSFKDRAIGLLATASLSQEEGLWLKPCRSVHTFFMRYPIDVIFLSAEGEVLHAATLGTWRLSRWVPRAVGVLEVQAGQNSRIGVRVGDRVRLEETR